VTAARLAFRAAGVVAPAAAARVAERIFTTPRRVPRPLSPAAEALAARATPLAAEHRRGALRGMAWGNGPVVLLAHGWESRWSSMAAFVEPLVARGFRVVAFDAPAHGASAGRQTDGVDYGRALSAAARAAGPVHGVVAHSFGAAAALLMLAGRSGLPWDAPRVDRLVLLAAPADLRDLVAGFARQLALPARAERALLARLEARVGLPASAFSLAEAAAELLLPLLVVHDRDDASVPFADADAFARAQPRAELVATHGLGHNRLLRAPEVVRRVVDFLAPTRMDHR
jgi:pimeloyl-ACP methyl ester carboxylesterase